MAINYDIEYPKLQSKVAKLEAENQRLRDLLFKYGAMDDPPCFVCGYNGAGYYNPDKHSCAALHHKALEQSDEL